MRQDSSAVHFYVVEDKLSGSGLSEDRLEQVGPLNSSSSPTQKSQIYIHDFRCVSLYLSIILIILYVIYSCLVRLQFFRSGSCSSPRVGLGRLPSSTMASIYFQRGSRARQPREGDLGQLQGLQWKLYKELFVRMESTTLPSSWRIIPAAPTRSCSQRARRLTHSGSFAAQKLVAT